MPEPVTEADWKLEEPYTPDLLKQGEEGKMRVTRLWQHLRWLREQGNTEEQSVEVLIPWNLLNKPPLAEADLKAKINWAYRTW